MRVLWQMMCGLVLVMLAGGVAVAAPRLIEGDDAEGAPYRQAVRALLESIAAGDMEAAKEAFAGEGDALRLLEQTVESNQAFQRFQAAVKERFADVNPRLLEDFVAQELRTLDQRQVAVDPERPGEASLAPSGSFPFAGFRLRQLEGEWRVEALTVFPQNVPQMLAVHEKLEPALDGLAKRVSEGEFETAQELMQAAQQTLGPIMAEAPRGGGGQTTRPAGALVEPGKFTVPPPVESALR